MRFPFIARKDHEALVSVLERVIEDQKKSMAAQRTLIEQYQQEIQALVLQLTEQKAAPGPTLVEKKPFKPARLSYRSLAQQRSRETIRPPADSAAALEERVKKEGGI